MPTLQTLTGLFWIESIAYVICLIANGALALVVFGLRRRPNWPLTLLMLVSGLWATAALLLRLSAWLQLDNTALWLELSVIGMFLMGPAQLLFAASYVGYQRRWPIVLARILFLVIAAISLPLFQHRMIFDPYFEANGMLNYFLHPLALGSTLIPVAGYGGALYLFHSAARKPEERYLQVSALLWLLGFISGGALRPYFPFPTMSVLVTISSLMLSYGIVNRQVFNPLQALVVDLEQRLGQSAQDLAASKAELEVGNRSLARQRTLLEAASHVLHTVSTTPGPEKQLAFAARTIAVRFGLYHVGIFMLDAAGNTLQLKAASSDYGQMLVDRGYSSPLHDLGLIGGVARYGEAQLSLVGDAETLNSGWAETRSRIAAPLRIGGKVFGVLDLHSKQRGAFGGADITIFQLLADQLALIFVNTELTEAAASRVEAERRAYGEISVREWQALLTSRFVTGYYSDLAGVKPLMGAAELPATEGLTELALPLELRGQMIGKLVARKPASGVAWTDDEVTLLQSLVEQLVVALESARLYETAQRRAARERLIGDVMGRIRTSIDLQTVLKTAARELQLALKAPELTVQLLAPSEEQIEG